MIVVNPTTELHNRQKTGWFPQVVARMRGLFQPNVACGWVAADGDRFRFGIRRDRLDDTIAARPQLPKQYRNCRCRMRLYVVQQYNS